MSYLPFRDNPDINVPSELVREQLIALADEIDLSSRHGAHQDSCGCKDGPKCTFRSWNESHGADTAETLGWLFTKGLLAVDGRLTAAVSAVSADQPKPREWRDREGDLWRDVDADQVVLIECKGRLPETAVGPHSRAVVERSWGPLVEVLAVVEDQPKPRVWQDSDGDRWDEQPDGSLKLRAKSPTMSDNLVLTRRQADEFYGPLSEVLADSEQVTHG